MTLSTIYDGTFHENTLTVFSQYLFYKRLHHLFYIVKVYRRLSLFLKHRRGASYKG